MSLKTAIALVLSWMALAEFAGAANPAMPMIPSTVYNVTNYGAVGDGMTDNTAAIQNAIHAAAAAGGGTVEIPSGRFLSGPIALVSGIHLEVDTNGLLQMLPFGTYPGGATNALPFISCNRAHDVEISGWGRIDGQGADWWAAFLSKTNPILVRPMMLNLFSCNRLFIHDISFSNPPFHHCGLRDYGGNITISNVTIDTVSPSPNTDGLNFVGTNSIIEDCHISDGDDNIAMGSSGPIDDLLITHCTFGYGHGVSIGSAITAGISNLTVTGCTFNDTENGIRIKSNMGRSGVARNLNYFNLMMTNVNMPIVIYSYYNVTGTPRRIAGERVLDPANTAPVTATTPVWRDITISNVTISSPKGDIGGIIWGPAEMPITNLTIVNVTNNAPRAFDLYNVRGARIVDSEFNFASGSTFTLCNTDVMISNSAPTAQPVTIDAEYGANSLVLHNVRATAKTGNAFNFSPLTIDGGALTVDQDLNLHDANVQNLCLGTNPSSVGVNGDLMLGGTLNVDVADGFAAGNYILYTYAGSLSGGLRLGAMPPGFSGKLDTRTPGKVILAVSH